MIDRHTNLLTRYALAIVLVMVWILATHSQRITRAQLPDPPALLGQEGGSGSPALAVVGTTAYLGVGPRLVVVDVSNVYAPRWLGQSPPLPYVVQDVQVSGGLAYVVTGAGGLQILDVADPLAPRLRASLDTPGFAKGVRVANGLAYVADFGSGLALVDVHNPDVPALIARYATRGGPHAVDVAGQLVYVADDSSGLLIIDAANPANPVLRGAIKSAGVALDVQVVGAVAYLAYYNQGMRTIDVSNPAVPQRLGRLDTPGLARAVSVTGATAFVADGDRVLAVDVSNPAYPAVIASSRSVAVNAAASANRVYVTDRQQLTIFDVSDPTVLSRRSTYRFAGAAQAVDVAGSLAFVASRTDGLNIFDLDDPAHPRRLANLETPGMTLDVAYDANRVVIVGPAGLRLVDVSQPTVPVLRGTIPLAGWAQHVAVVNNVAVVAAGWGGVHVVDLSNPQAPIRRATFAAESAAGIDLAGTLAYVAAGKSLLVLDIANPTAPVLRSTTLLPGWGVAIRMQGSYAYVADAEAGLLILDVSNPTAPVLRGMLPTTNAMGLAVAGQHASIADNQGGVIVADISDPTRPVLLASFDTPGLARGLASAGQHVIVADDYGGLAIWRPEGGTPPTSTPTPTVTPSPTATSTPTPTPTPTVTPSPVYRYFPYTAR